MAREDIDVVLGLEDPDLARQYIKCYDWLPGPAPLTWIVSANQKVNIADVNGLDDRVVVMVAKSIYWTDHVKQIIKERAYCHPDLDCMPLH